MKKLLSVMLAVAMLMTAAFSVTSFQAFAADDINLVVKPESNDAAGATVAEADGVVTATITKAWDSASDAAFGIAMTPGVAYDPTQLGYVHLSIDSTVPFRVTFLDRATGLKDKWISFGSEFFNVMIPEGGTALTAAPDNGFYPAGKYEVACYINGLYKYKAENSEPEWTANSANVSGIYIEGKETGTITLNSMKLSAKETFDGTTAPTAPAGDGTTAAPAGATTTAAAGNSGAATTTAASSAKTGEESNALLFVVIAAVAVGVVAVTVVVSKKSRAK